MVKKKLQHNNTNICNVKYHIIWCPKYRKHLLTGTLEKQLKETLNNIAIANQFNIVNIEIMPDHLHLFISSSPKIPIQTIVQKLKGISSFELRKQNPRLKKYRSLWTRSYFVETIGHISEETIRKYIQDQKFVG